MKPLILLLLSIAPLLSCSDVVEPTDVVTEIEICNRSCNGTIYQTFATGVQFDGHVTVHPGDCETYYIKKEFGYTGADSIGFYYYEDSIGGDQHWIKIPLNRKTFQLPCD